MRGLSVGLLGEFCTQEKLLSYEEQMQMLWGFQATGIGALEK